MPNPNTGYWSPGPEPVGPPPVILPIDDTFGYKETGPGDCIALTELLDSVGKVRQNLQILEIGSWAGSGSTQVFAEKAKQYGGELTCIDTWKGGNADLHRNIVGMLDIFGTFLHNTKKFDNITVIRGNSSKVHKILQHHSFDVIFIDADHSYNGFISDLYNYYPKLKPDGIFCGHDCELPWDAVADNVKSELNLEDDYHQTHYIHAGVVKGVNDFTKTLGLSDKLKTWSSEYKRIGGNTIWSITLDQNICLSHSQASSRTSPVGTGPS